MNKPLRPGDPHRLGDYEMVARLGEGGMGTVFLARSSTGRLVAVKVIRPEFAYEDEFRGRFRSEVDRARQVPPFCTAEVLDADPEHRTPYLVVEYVDGPTLAEVVERQGPLTAGSLHSVAIGVATALTAIHGAGVIHRDLKPRNVLFALGSPKVIDFGIARALEMTSQHTRTDQMVGTVSYMAPERFDGTASRSISPAADVFAWGAVVTYAGTGRTPFIGDSPAATAARILTQPPELSGLSGPLRELVAMALAKDPADRPTARDLLDLLLAVGPQDAAGLADTLAERPELSRAATAAQRFGTSTGGRRVTVEQPSPRRRTGRLVAVAALAVTLAAVGAVLGVPQSRRALISSGPQGTDTAAASTSASVPVPATAAPQAVTSVRGPTVIDRLDRAAQWRVRSDDDGSCTFAGKLVVATGQSGVVRCPGPADSFAGDQSITADVTVVRPGSCAMIWFRYVDVSGYRLSICSGVVAVELDNDDRVTVVQSFPLTTFRPGSSHRAGIAIRGDVATISVDGAPIGTAAVADRSLVAGKVLLGVATETWEDEARAGFADIEIRSL